MPALSGLLLLSSAGAGVWGERGYNSGSSPCVWLSNSTCFHGSPVFLHRHSLLRLSSLPSPQSISPQPTAVLTLGLFSSPHALAPRPLAHLWTHVPVGTLRAPVQIVCVSLCPVCHRSAASASSDSLKCFPSVPIDFPIGGFPSGEGVSPDSGISPLLQLPRPGVQVPSHFLSSSFPLLFSVLPSYAGIVMVLSGVQGLLLVFRWCSVRTVKSIDVFLMHLRRELTSMSSYSSAVFEDFFFGIFFW